MSLSFFNVFFLLHCLPLFKYKSHNIFTIKKQIAPNRSSNESTVVSTTPVIQFEKFKIIMTLYTSLFCIDPHIKLVLYEVKQVSHTHFINPIQPKNLTKFYSPLNSLFVYCCRCMNIISETKHTILHFTFLHILIVHIICLISTADHVYNAMIILAGGQTS